MSRTKMPTWARCGRANRVMSLSSQGESFHLAFDIFSKKMSAVRAGLPESFLSDPRFNAKGSRFSTANRSEEHTSELQSLMRISYAVFCLKKKKKTTTSKQATTSKAYYITQTNNRIYSNHRHNYN